MNILSKINKLISFKEKKSLYLILFLIILSSILETVGIGLIIPIIKVIFSNDLNTLLLTYENTYFIGNFINFFLKLTKTELIIFFLSVLSIFYILKSYLLIFFIYLRELKLDNINDRLTEKLFNKYLSQDYLFHTNKNSADLIRNIQAVPSIKNSINSILNILSEIIFLIFIVSFLIYIEPFGSLLILILTSLICLFYFLFFKTKLDLLSKSNLKFSSLFHRLIIQSLGGIKLLKLYSNENFFSNLLGMSRQNLSKISRGTYLVTISSRYILEALAVIIMSVLLFFVSQTNTLENVFIILAVFTLAGFKIIPSANKILMGLGVLKYSIPQINLIFDDFDIREKEINHDYDNDFEFKNKIELKKINFHYPNKEKNIFTNFNLNIIKGEMVGLIGESGSGKSTLLDLLSGLINPDVGEVLIDGSNIKKIKKNYLKKISYISQNPYLFDDTIEANITFGSQLEVKQKLLLKCVQESQLEKFVNNLPNGLKTLVGERGSQISGGQAQRVAIARALYKQSDILIFDEPTSSLDEENEKKFFEIIYALRKKKTIIVSSHKKNNLVNCDKIINLGKIN